jgi:hypothetical protein
MSARDPRRCVFTALMGDYEELNEQPMALQSKLPFICFTDNPDLTSETWQIRLLPPMFGLDPARSQRDVKLRPFVHLPEYELSLYIDNSVLLTRPPEQIFEELAPASGIFLFRHSFRDSVLDEFLEVAKRGLDDQARIFEQLNHYSLLHPEVLEERPYWGGMLLCDHRIPTVRTTLDIWYANVLRYSRRDQLSVNAAFRQAGFVPDTTDADNRESAFHSWPHTSGRKLERGFATPTESIAASLSPPVARIRVLERQLAEAIQTRNSILSSGTWRIGERVSRAITRHPRLLGSPARVARRILIRR